MRIILTRDGRVKGKINTGKTFDDTAAIKFLAEIITKDEKLKIEDGGFNCLQGR